MSTSLVVRFGDNGKGVICVETPDELHRAVTAGLEMATVVTVEKILYFDDPAPYGGTVVGILPPIKEE